MSYLTLSTRAINTQRLFHGYHPSRDLQVTDLSLCHQIHKFSPIMASESSIVTFPIYFLGRTHPGLYTYIWVELFMSMLPSTVNEPIT